MDKAKKDTYFPVFAICEGFQVLAALTSTPNVIEFGEFDSFSLTLPLTLNNQEVQKSRLFNNEFYPMIKPLLKEKVTANLHNDGIYPDTFQNNEMLHSFWRVLSTNVDRKGTPFVSTIEAIDYPIFATQWHPERPPFDIGSENNINNKSCTDSMCGIAHSIEAITVSNYTSNFFVNQCR